MTWCQNTVKQARKCAKIGIPAISNTARSNMRSIFETDYPLIKYSYMMTWCQNIVKQASRCAKIADQVILRVARLKITLVFYIDHPLIRFSNMMTCGVKALSKQAWHSIIILTPRNTVKRCFFIKFYTSVQVKLFMWKRRRESEGNLPCVVNIVHILSKNVSTCLLLFKFSRGAVLVWRLRVRNIIEYDCQIKASFLSSSPYKHVAAAP